jgi:hypothetical protein
MDWCMNITMTGLTTMFSLTELSLINKQNTMKPQKKTSLFVRFWINLAISEAIIIFLILIFKTN